MAKHLLGYGQQHGPWLFGLTPGRASKLTWTAFKQALRDARPRTRSTHPVLVMGQELARLLGLDESETAILMAVLAFERLPRVAELADLIAGRGQSLPVVLGQAAGIGPAQAESEVRRHLLFRLGFVTFKADWQGRVEMSLRWTFRRLLDRQPDNAEAILELMVGPRQPAPLPLDAFTHIPEADFLRRLISGALRERASGVNILIHGPPGTGKTEFARALAKAAGARLHAVGEALDDGEEPDRVDRIVAFQMGQRLLTSSPDGVLLFDEMEDFIGDVQPAEGDWYRRREGSKVFVNRLIETNAVPVIWTTNAIGNVDPAILRRMSFVLKLDPPSTATALRMLDRIGAEEGLTLCRDWQALVACAPEAAAVLRVSARAERLAGTPGAGIVAARSLTTAIRGHALPPVGRTDIDLDLYESDRPIAALVQHLCASEHTDISILLTGPPGTGKTALAHHFARAMDRPLMVRRTSDLLSKWVGETEANIADTFADARAKGCVLLLDEVDSLLFDRSTARATWEVSQVNELLTWLDNHPFPVIAATNFSERLDPATSRRFVFKLALKPLSGERLNRAFARFFALSAPPTLEAIRNLTPGDFAVVAKQLRHSKPMSAQEIVARLALEAGSKAGVQHRIGF
jgi:AAA+ superfamily predicted ATPase